MANTFAIKKNIFKTTTTFLKIKKENKPVEPFQNYQHHHNYLRNLKINFN